MKKIQKITFISGLIVASIFFIYTLSFSSGWALGQPLGEFYSNAQEVNKLIYKYALWTVVFAALNIIFNSHRNRRVNIITLILSVALMMSLVLGGITTISKVTPLKASYLELDEAFLSLITAINYSKVSTDIFDYGIIISIIMFIQAVLIFFVTFMKIKSQVKRAKLKKL